MKPIVIHYSIGISDYRRMLYFNTFSLRRAQNFLIAVSWATAAFLLALNLIGTIQPSPVMHFCFLVVTVSVPMILVSLEIRIRRSRGAQSLSQPRSIILEENGLRYQSEGNPPSKLEKWEDLLAIYETKTAFLIYKDVNNIVLMPKREQQAEKLKDARNLFRRALGGHFRLRCK